MPTKIPEDLVDFLESGVSILVGTRNAKNEPEATRSCGAQVSKDREHVSLWFPDWAKGAVQDIEENGHVAVCFSRMLDNYSIQLKGENATVRDAAEAERKVAERYSREGRQGQRQRRPHRREREVSERRRPARLDRQRARPQTGHEDARMEGRHQRGGLRSLDDVRPHAREARYEDRHALTQEVLCNPLRRRLRQ